MLILPLKIIKSKGDFMNEAVYLDSLFDAETEYWDEYWHNPDFKRMEDVDIPDWLEEE